MKNLLKKTTWSLFIFMFTLNLAYAGQMIDMTQEKIFSEILHQKIENLKDQRGKITTEDVLKELKKNNSENMAYLRKRNIFSPEQLALAEEKMQNKLAIYSAIDDHVTLLELRISELQSYQSSYNYLFLFTRELINDSNSGNDYNNTLLLPFTILGDIILFAPALFLSIFSSIG